MKQQDSVYLYMNPNKNVPHFYELLGGRHLLYLTFRVLRIRTADNTYEYIITNLPHEFDFSTALRTARKYFLRDTLTKPVDIIRLLCKYVHAVKEEFRLFPRNLRGIGAIRFNYR